MSEISSGNPLDQNKSGKVHIKTTNFPMHFHKYMTARFGEYGCIGVFNGIAKDKVQMRQILDVNTYTLKAPLLTPITMNRVYTQVPKMAILPNAWPLIYVNPSVGDDIDAAEYGTSVKKENMASFLTIVKDEVKTAITNITSQTAFNSIANAKTYLTNLIHSLAMAELIYSNGSLINNMQAHLARLWPDTTGRTFDYYFEKIWAGINQMFGALDVTNTRTNKSYIVKLGGFDQDAWTNATTVFININEFLTELRDGDKFTITSIRSAAAGNGPLADSNISGPMTGIKTILVALDHLDTNAVIYYKPFQLERLWAYQLSCAEFFTNDKVDYIYNADTFRNYIGSLYREVIVAEGDEAQMNRWQYNWNGQTIAVDWLSAHVFNYMSYLANAEDAARAYIFALFKFNRSLKYKDYFTGSRTRPIAIGNTNVTVNNNTVEIIDVVQNIQKQRFLNVVNKIPRDLKGYTKGIFGKDIAPDWHNPLFLCKISESIYGQETENTGAAQLTEKQTRTSTLKNEGNRIQVEFNLDRDSIIIGFVYFDIPRAYSKGVQRSFMDVDRYDFFNPYLQYAGDQPVYKEEYDILQTGTFGYQGAYMHMKQEVNDAAGGFIENLDGWTFLDQYIETDKRGIIWDNIGPDFIRSKPSELDRFYISLSGRSMAAYFHFIIDVETHYNARRPMAYNPQIL